eukprot:TRINITY_DN89744_c0_g1_i1.p2 TRINITY_DN89744_c0_g1~~TRINITY_DN89744_c0_g1_i1.p2  ORF type:complete len:157 (+),score=39.33 TRINITY_DN89744_c0_g1_i1:58-528(+)
MAGAGQDEGSPASMAEWQQAVEELKQVDQTMEELREELAQFEQRRQVLSSREALLRKRLTAAGQVLPAPGAEGAPGGYASGTSEASTAKDPVFFQLGDEGHTSRPASIEDWEAGLDMLATAGKSKDRASGLRAHFLMTGSKHSIDNSNSPIKQPGH